MEKFFKNPKYMGMVTVAIFVLIIVLNWGQLKGLAGSTPIGTGE